MTLTGSDLGLLCAFHQDLQTRLLNFVSNISSNALVILSYVDKAHEKYVSHYICYYNIQLKRKISLGGLAAQGDLHLLNWTQEQFKIIKTVICRCIWKLTPDVCAEAAKHGHFEVLKWAREKGCDWNVYTVNNAAESGHLQILQWAVENGCWCVDDAWCCAIKEGHLHVIKWMVEYSDSINFESTQNFKVDSNWTHYIAETAARYGQLDILIWADTNFTTSSNEVMHNNAIRCGHLNIVKWLRNSSKHRNIPMDKMSQYSTAAHHGQIEILEWFTEQDGTGWHIDIVKPAIYGCRPYNSKRDSKGKFHRSAIGQINVLEWLINKGYDLTKTNICHESAAQGALNVLKWAREKGYPWDKSVTQAAIINDSHEVYEWAITNGCPVDHDRNKEIFERIAEQNYLEHYNQYHHDSSSDDNYYESNYDDDYYERSNYEISHEIVDYPIENYYSDRDEHLHTTKLESNDLEIKAYTDAAINYDIYNYADIHSHGNNCDTCSRHHSTCGMREDVYVYDVLCNCFMCTVIRKLPFVQSMTYDDYVNDLYENDEAERRQEGLLGSSADSQ